MSRKLSALVAGDQFRWPDHHGGLFLMTSGRTVFEGKQMARVVYLEPGGLGYAKLGDKGLIPLDDDAHPPTKRKEASK